MDSLETGRIRARMPSPIFLPPSHWLGKLFTLPQLSTVFLIQDGGLNNWISTRAAKIRLHCPPALQAKLEPAESTLSFACSNNLLLWQIKLLNLWPLKSLRLPWMQFFTNSCRFLLALFCAGFSGHLLPLILPVCMFCLSSCCTWLLAISPSCFHCFRSYIFCFALFIATCFPFEYFSCSPNMFLYFV